MRSTTYMNNDNIYKWAFPSFVREKMKNPKKQLLFSELASLLSSGLDFSTAFLLLISGEKNVKLNGLLKGVYDHVVSGGTMADGFKRSRRFTDLDVGVIRIGEETGRLTESLEFLADYYNKKILQARMVSSAVSYPLVVLATAVTVVIFMLSVIVPMFEQVYARMGGELPGITRGIIMMSQQFPKYFTIFALVATTVTLLLYFKRNSAKLKSILTSLILKTPIIGNILKRNYQAHFCKLLCLIISSGIPLLYGIQMLKSVIKFYPYHHSLAILIHNIEMGGSLTHGLSLFPQLFDKKLIALLRVGEETNRLPQMLLRQSDDLTKELEHSLKQLGAMLEPILILFIGSVVAIIMISMYLPMFKMGGTIH